MAKNVSIPTKVITGVNTRWSYANVWDPKSINGGAPKYSVSLIIHSLTSFQAYLYNKYIEISATINYILYKTTSDVLQSCIHHCSDNMDILYTQM